MSEQDEQIEGLRKDLFLATANRGLVYTAILREMRKELGEEKASEIFKRAIFDHGVRMAGFLNPPSQPEEFKDWLLAFLPDGGAVIDTPGMREIQVWSDDESVQDSFNDIEEIAVQCRFTDCRHDTEPGCAVQTAILHGDLDAARELQLKMLPVNQAVTAAYGVPGLKAAMDMRGYFGGDPRLPLLPSSEQVRSEIEAILKKADLLN